MASAAPTADELKNAMREILKQSDLSSLSSKKVRKQLEEKFQRELSSRKEEIDRVLMELVSQLEGEEDGGSSGEESTSNGNQNQSDDDASSDTSLTKEPPRKKKKVKSQKVSNETVDDSDVDDESLARELQKKELGVRPRSRKAAQVKVKKPASEKASGGPKKNSVYSRECVLSEDLAAVMGADKMARKDVVKGMWAIFRERDLLDPKNRQYVNCDEQLEKIFKVKKFKAFGMMKILKKHIKDEKLVTT